MLNTVILNRHRWNVVPIGLKYIVAMVIAPSVASCYAQSVGHDALFTKLGSVVAAPWNQVFAKALSGDGYTVIGTGRQSSGGWTGAFRWQRSSGFAWITDIYPQRNEFRYLSHDGGIIGGHRIFTSSVGSSGEATRWVDLNPSWIGFAAVAAMSEDGQTFVLNGGPSSSYMGVVAIWRDGQQQSEIIFGPSATQRYATAANADCSIVAGQLENDLFRWTRQGGVQRIMLPPGSSSGAVARIAADGSMIGHVYRTREQAFRWTVEEGFQFLGSLENLPATVATATSADGRIIVGFAHASYSHLTPFLWTRPTGMLNLRSLLSQFDPEIASEEVKRVDAVSADGGVFLITDSVSWHCALPCPFAIGPLAEFTACRNSPVDIEIVSTGSCDVTFQWRHNGQSLLDDSRTQGVATQRLTIMNPTSEDDGLYDCVASTSTREYITTQALVRVCVGDYTCDGGVDGADLVAFFSDWEAGEARSDVNDDGGIDGSDVGEFLCRWETGC
jgi:uncharacterized membrane protein